jgi:hypothetical protein
VPSTDGVLYFEGAYFGVVFVDFDFETIPRRVPHHTLPPKGGAAGRKSEPSRFVSYVIVHNSQRPCSARKWRGISVPMTRVARGQVVQRDKISITRRSDRTIRFVERPRRSALVYGSSNGKKMPTFRHDGEGNLRPWNDSSKTFGIACRRRPRFSQNDPSPKPALANSEGYEWSTGVTMRHGRGVASIEENASLRWVRSTNGLSTFLAGTVNEGNSQTQFPFCRFEAGRNEA